MEKDLEKQIEEAAKRLASKFPENNQIEVVFHIGALSIQAKEYWQQGLYTEEEVFNLAWQLWEGFLHETKEYPDYHTWFKQNKKK